ncbi:S-layer homology domain-containing protein [Lysinibacillus macroides]|uniref:S-layer homology domain-containing protein n=1 Tax=Lysinibacillus macroides TaxID=33935 RepID=UPI0006B483EE|nr:S-layer homology domain-containing protein [Lysinibacillus macroides]QPR68647.1 S-layer homology domain-containing protein [Lysinibacillus macroides]
MKKNKLFIAATVTATSAIVAGAGITAQAAPSLFSDVSEKSSHYPAIMDLTQRGIIHGYGDGTFKPNEVVTHGQAAKIIAGVIGLDGSDEEILAVLQQSGVLADTSYSNEPVTRYQMATIITHVLQLPTVDAITMPFTDVSMEHQSAVAALFTYGITTGTSATTFSGDKVVTRGQLATFIVRAEQIMQQFSTGTEIIGATITVEDIQNNTLSADGQEWSIGANAQTVLNDNNAAALAGALLDVIVVDGEIAEVMAIDLKASGQRDANVVLDGGNTTIGNIVVDADFVELQNLVVTADIRVTGRATQIVLDQLEIKGELLVQEAEAPKTASLTNIAVTDQVPIGVNITRAEFAMQLLRSGVINSDTHIPNLSNFSADLEINAPSVGTFFWQPQLAGAIISGSTTIGTTVIDTDYTTTLQEMVKRLGIQQQQQAARQETLEELRRQQQQNLLQQIQEEIEKRRQQQEEAAEKQRQKAQENFLKELEELGKQQQRSTLPVNIGGNLKFDDMVIPPFATIEIALGEGVHIDNVLTQTPAERVSEMFKNLRQNQINTLTSANGQQAPYHPTPASPDNNSSSSGSNTGGGGSGGGSTEIPLVTTNLETMITHAQEKLNEVQEGATPLSENGYTISYMQQWIPQLAVDTLEAAISEAQALVAHAKNPAIAYQRVASLTTNHLRVATTQTDINRMVEKLEKLMNIQPIAYGLQEKAILHSLLDGKNITSIPEGEDLDAGRVYEAIWSMLQEALTDEQQFFLELVQEIRHTIQIEGNQVILPLNEAILYTDPMTNQATELVPAITAQLAVVQPVMINEVTFIDAENIRLTFASNIEVQNGEQFILMLEDSLNPIYGTVSSSATNSVDIQINGSVPSTATFIQIERESNPGYNLLQEPFTMVNTNV